jgi:hypothetical protein
MLLLCRKQSRFSPLRDVGDDWRPLAVSARFELGLDLL